MASLAFSLKAKPAKPTMGAANPFGAAAAAADDDDDSKPAPARDLVIPLTTNPWAKAKAEAPAPAPATAAAPEPTTEDEAAAAAIIAEGVMAKPKEEALVIERADAGALDASQPLLVAAMLPGLAEVDDDGEKFRRDVALRAEDIDCDSAAYRTVRIEEFGKGLLRGMGWGGMTEDDEKRFADPVRRGAGSAHVVAVPSRCPP